MAYFYSALDRLTRSPIKNADYIPSSMARLPVAQYLRMSTEHQQYSTENQSISIVQYAQMHNMEIVRTYADHGKSGLSLARRPGLQQLLRDALASDVDFRAVLVYDVSRWGRFQNPDQGASYEYALITADIPIHYCAEQFANDGSLSSALLKTLKRGMAGEYSRELSVKVWAGQSRLVQLGFRLGGIPGYGLRRHLIDQNMVFKQVLKPGDRKSLQTDRVILVPALQKSKWFAISISCLRKKSSLNPPSQMHSMQREYLGLMADHGTEGSFAKYSQTQNTLAAVYTIASPSNFTRQWFTTRLNLGSAFDALSNR